MNLLFRSPINLLPRSSHRNICYFFSTTSPPSNKTISTKIFQNLSFSSFIPHSLFFSTMAGELESLSTTVVSDEFGFERAEMYQGNLAGTVDPYDRHLFLCYKSHELWPSRVESSDSDPLPKLLASVLKARKDDIPIKTRLTISEGGDDLKLSDGDILVFPEMMVYRGLKDSDVVSFVDDVLVNGKFWGSGVQEELTGSYVFVCAHNNRDQRCGVCGPILIEKFKEEIESQDLRNQVLVTACSHVGGHKYAGNVIIFSADTEGQIVGNWYGYVTPNDVLELLNKQIGKGEVINRLWRGQMGAPVIEAKKDDESTLVNGTNLNMNDKQPEENGSAEISENGTGEKSEIEASCCQGANGFSCCNEDKLPQENGTVEKSESVANSCCQGAANGFSCCRDESYEQKPISKGLGTRLSYWKGKLEQRHVLTTVAVVGAVATVVVAYSFYRRAR